MQLRMIPSRIDRPLRPPHRVAILSASKFRERLFSYDIIKEKMVHAFGFITKKRSFISDFTLNS
jgi:hypothetical protein